MARFIDESVTVQITRMEAIDPLDGRFTGEADFTSRVTIDGLVDDGRKFADDDDLNPGTAWTFTNTSSQLSGAVPIRIRINEEDTGSNTHVDINPLANKKDLEFFFNQQTGEVFSTETGVVQRLGFANQPITLAGRAGDESRGRITFVVSGKTVAPNSPDSVLIQSGFGAETPENGDRLGGHFSNGNHPLVVGDFNDDGRDDLVVTALAESLAHVSYGSTSGLTSIGTQTFGNTFGSLAVGDINGDGVDDLVSGTGGTATIQFGRAGSGLNNGQQVITRSPAFPRSVIFGETLATGDFNGDGKDDVAVGDPLADSPNSNTGNDGAVQINYGSSAGISTIGQQVFHRDTPGIPGGHETFNTRFAGAMASGDLNGDGFDDLVVGAPGAGDTAPSAGVFHVLYGSRTGLSTTNNQLIGQFFSGLADKTGDEFGAAIAVADVNGDRVDDVIVGAPGRNNGAGQVYVYHGRRGGSLSQVASRIINQNDIFSGPVEAGDNFGAAIAAQDINNDGFADVFIGAPGEDSGAGTVHRVLGRSTGVSSSNLDVINLRQGVGSVTGTRETGDRFGTGIAIGNFNGSGLAEFAVSAPFENFGTVNDAGMVNIISNSTDVLVGLSGIQSTKAGTNSNEVLRGTAANGILDGRGGHDRIFTSAGNDIAIGGVGNDDLDGGTGDDLLYGGKGLDTLKGGRGRDVFVLAPQEGPDLIKDFRQGEDFIGLAKGLQFEDLRLIQRGSSTVIKTGRDHLATLQGVNANQLSLNDFMQVGFTRFQDMTVPTLVA